MLGKAEMCTPSLQEFLLDVMNWKKKKTHVSLSVLEGQCADRDTGGNLLIAFRLKKQRSKGWHEFRPLGGQEYIWIPSVCLKV